MKILGMGNALVDVLSSIESDRVLDELSMIKGSMQLIDNDVMNTLLEDVVKDNRHLATGGSASNTISGLAKLGTPTGFLGKVGKDSIGEFFKNDASKQGVQTHLLTSENNSGCCIALISPDGERTMNTYLGAACELDVEDLDISIFKDYSVLHIEGYLVANQGLIEQAMALAKKSGLKVSIDLASFNVVDANLDFLKKLVHEYVDIVFANEEEAQSFTGKIASEAVAHIAEMCEIAVVKIGKEGSYVKANGGEQVYVPATMSKALDTTGAGDLYASGFLFGFTSGYPLELCGKIGSIVAGHVVEVIGAKMDDTRWDMIKEDIKKHLPASPNPSEVGGLPYGQYSSTPLEGLGEV
jgi:sugar/nucleoside kinase (ribokinase family)